MALAFAQHLTGWGRYPLSSANVELPENCEEVQRIVNARSPTIARGLGRSYADQALNNGGHVTVCTRLDRYIDFSTQEAKDGQAEFGRLRCESGTSLAQILEDFAPLGFFPQITPGTKYVTIGGCIANDVHGKGHHVDGSFSRCVESFRLLTGDGQILDVSRESHPDLFWSNFGGLGLLGIIVDATILLRKIETTWFRQQAVVVRNLEELLDAFETYAEIPYAVAWIDSLATGNNLGRGVLTMGSHASAAELPPALAKKRLAISGPPRISVPFDIPGSALNVGTVSILNRVLHTIQSRAKNYSHYEKFFYPLDAIAHWNRGYGPRGFTQYQFVVPAADGRTTMHRALSMIASSGQMPFLNVLKKLGAGEGMLSFPMHGYTFAIDFPIKPSLPAFLRELDALVMDAGGRVYLGKDAFLSATSLAKMYPQVDEWKAIKAKYDPKQRFVSDIGKRLGLCV
jgi:FAD/FMN-containing dehydrogenase